VLEKTDAMEICMSRASATIDFLSRYVKPPLQKENMKSGSEHKRNTFALC
jgi:hypothetical protein